jgi:hypothetical protein
MKPINPEGLVMVIRRLWGILEFSTHYTYFKSKCIDIYISIHLKFSIAIVITRFKCIYNTIKSIYLSVFLSLGSGVYEVTHYTHLEINHMHTYTCIRLNNIGNRCWYSSIMHNLKFILCMIDSLTFFIGVV